MKRTYQPSKIKRTHTCGFRARMATKGGRAVLNRRRAKGRAKLTQCQQTFLLASIMKKLYRLKKSEDFKKVLDQRHCAGKNESVSIYYASNDLKHARIGISVSTKIGNAIVRARVRRQIRAQINLTDVLSKPFDIVIITQHGYIHKTFQENTASIKALFSHLGQSPKGDKA